MRKQLNNFNSVVFHLYSLFNSNHFHLNDLFAASNHIGSIYGEHYIAYPRHEANDENE
jgi:hypothetical protein